MGNAPSLEFMSNYRRTITDMFEVTKVPFIFPLAAALPLNGRHWPSEGAVPFHADHHGWTQERLQGLGYPKSSVTDRWGGYKISFYIATPRDAIVVVIDLLSPTDLLLTAVDSP